MIDIPIGSEIILKVVEDKKGDCIGCFFDELQSDIYENPCKRIKCSSNERKDRKKVKFIRVK